MTKVPPRRRRLTGTSEEEKDFSMGDSANVKILIPIPEPLQRQYVANCIEDIINCRLTESDVKPYREVLAKRIMPYKVKRVISPFEFYVEYALESVDTYNEWFHKMQKFYDTPKMQRDWKADKIMQALCYICKSMRDNNWHRVRAYDVDQKSKSALVFFCDTGEQQVVHFNDLYRIHPSFTLWAAQLFRAYLYDIMPIHGSMEWSTEAIKFFEEKVKGKKFSGIVCARSDDIMRYGYPEIMSNIGVVLVEIPSNSQSGKSCSLNSILVEKGFAQSLGVHSTCRHFFNDGEYTPNFDKDNFNKTYPQAALQPTPPSSPPPVFDPKDDNFALAFRPKRTWLPADEKEDNPNDEYGDLNDFTNTLEKLPRVFRSTMCHVKLSFVIGPSFIYVHMVENLEMLRRMQRAIMQMIEDDQEPNIKDLVPGMFLAVSIQQDDDANKKMWCRAVVKIVNGVDGTVKILLPDYGNMITIGIDHSRHLPQYFHHIPAFAFRVHLDTDGIIPTGEDGWSEDSKTVFRRYAYAWSDQNPKYFIYKPAHSQRLILSDYTQEIVFDSLSKKWIAGIANRKPSNRRINCMHEHPMLHNLFSSTGVALEYEISLEKSAFYFFSPLHDDLLESGFAKCIKDLQVKEVLHVNLTEKKMPVVNHSKKVEDGDRRSYLSREEENALKCKLRKK